MRYFVESQILWDTSKNYDDLVNEFIGHFYKDAAEEIRTYYDLTRMRYEQASVLNGTSYASDIYSNIGDSDIWTEGVVDQIDRIFKKAGFVPKNVTEASSNMTALSLSANAGLGITIVPERAVETFADKDKLKIYRYSEQQDTWDINAVYKKDTYLGKAERALIDIIKETFN